MSYNYLSDYKKYTQHYRTDNEAGLQISVIHLPANAAKTRLSRLLLVLVPFLKKMENLTDEAISTDIIHTCYSGMQQQIYI